MENNLIINAIKKWLIIWRRKIIRHIISNTWIVYLYYDIKTKERYKMFPYQHIVYHSFFEFKNVNELFKNKQFIKYLFDNKEIWQK